MNLSQLEVAADSNYLIAHSRDKNGINYTIHTKNEFINLYHNESYLFNDWCHLNFSPLCELKGPINKLFMGQVLLFKDSIKDENWENFIFNEFSDYVKSLHLEVQMKKDVVCIYMHGSDINTIKQVMNFIRVNFTRKPLYFKLDVQTKYKMKYKDRNYLFTSSFYNNINITTYIDFIHNFRDTILKDIDIYTEVKDRYQDEIDYLREID